MSASVIDLAAARYRKVGQGSARPPIETWSAAAEQDSSASVPHRLASRRAFVSPPIESRRGGEFSRGIRSSHPARWERAPDGLRGSALPHTRPNLPLTEVSPHGGESSATSIESEVNRART